MQFNSNDSGSSLQSEINITPLVDVVLVLLIIFMVVVPLLMEGYDVDIPRASADASAQAEESQLILTIGSAACPILAPPAEEGIPSGLSGDPGGSKDSCNRIARARGGDPGRPARGTARAVPGRRRPHELRGGSAHHRSREVGRRGFEDRIYRDQLRWLLGDNHGSEEQFQSIRGSDGPQHGDEPRAPCPRAGRADAHTGAGAASQRAARTENSTSSSIVHRRSRSSREPWSLPMPRRTNDGRVPTGSARTRAEAETERAGRSRQAWQAGTATGSGGGLSSGAEARAEGGKDRHPGIQGQVREPGTGQGRAASRSRCASRCRR